MYSSVVRLAVRADTDTTSVRCARDQGETKTEDGAWPCWAAGWHSRGVPRALRSPAYFISLPPPPPPFGVRGVTE